MLGLSKKGAKVSFTAESAAFLCGSAPDSAFRAARLAYQFAARPVKIKGEMGYWRLQALRGGNGKLSEAYYRPNVLAMARGVGENFFGGKTVADFGCGPRGSLARWADCSVCIRNEVFAGDYLEEFGPDMASTT